MPYINKDQREYFDQYLNEDFLTSLPYITSGELNYLITKLLISTEPKNYRDYNKLIGVLESVKLELYRRLIAKYEDKKIEENGDVY